MRKPSKKPYVVLAIIIAPISTVILGFIGALGGPIFLIVGVLVGLITPIVWTKSEYDKDCAKYQNYLNSIYVKKSAGVTLTPQEAQAIGLPLNMEHEQVYQPAQEQAKQTCQHDNKTGVQ